MLRQAQHDTQNLELKTQNFLTARLQNSMTA